MSKENRLKFSTEVEVSDVVSTLTKNYIEVITDYFELQRIWLNNAYITFKDLDNLLMAIIEATIHLLIQLRSIMFSFSYN